MKSQSKRDRRINKRKNKIESKNNIFFRSIINGFGLSIGFSLGIILLLILAYAGWHPASQIISGVFKGNYTFAGNVKFDKNVTVHNVSIVPLGKNKTVYLYSSMTTEQIQKIIDEQPKYIPAGKSLTFQFTNGVYNLNNTLKFAGFYGGGSLIIQGNTTEPDATTLHTNQEVFLNFTKNKNLNNLYIYDCNLFVTIRNIRLEFNSSFYSGSAWPTGIRTYLVPFTYIMYNYVFGTSTTYGIGYNIYNANGDLEYNYVSNVNRGISAEENGKAFSYNNCNISVAPKYGLYAQTTGTIGTYLTQPQGTVNNTYSRTGGEIR